LQFIFVADAFPVYFDELHKHSAFCHDAVMEVKEKYNVRVRPPPCIAEEMRRYFTWIKTVLSVLSDAVFFKICSMQTILLN
jgi:hypothetical protein